MEPERAAGVILRGVVKNKAVILFPSVPKLVWLLYSVLPGLYRFISRRMFRKFRALRKTG
jgi:predicted DCC family thiol-disulfide oxidoreductase YuxK